MHRIGSLFLLFLTTHAIQADWGTYQGNASHTGYVPVSINASALSISWQTTVPSTDAINGLAVGGGNVLVTNRTFFSSQPSFHSLQQGTGALQWSKNFGTSNATTSPPAYANGVAYVQTDGHTFSGGNYLRAYNATTGAQVFQTSYEAQWETYLNPTPYAGTIYTGGGYYGGMYAHNAATGAQNWFGSVPQYDGWTPALDAQYAYSYTGSGSTSPVQGVFRKTNRMTGSTVASYIDPVYNWTGYTMNSAVVLGSNNNAITINGNRLVSWNTNTTTIGWSITSGFRDQPTLANGKLYVINGSSLAVLNELTGASLGSWLPPTGSLTGPIIALDNVLFVQTASQTYALDINTLQPFWSTPITGVMAFSDDALFIGQANGTVTRFVTAVPEPTTVVLLGVVVFAGLVGCRFYQRYFRRVEEDIIVG